VAGHADPGRRVGDDDLCIGIRQSFGLIMPPLTRDIAVSVSDFALAGAITAASSWTL
jgi:hypothetical protein